MKVFIGYDEREDEAARVAIKSLRKVAPDLEPVLLCENRLRAQGLFTRPIDFRGADYDLVSNAPQSTRFAVTRFLVPMLAQQGMALFVDCDVVFREDPRALLKEISSERAVSVVKHPQHRSGAQSGQLKMGNQMQTAYARKNWSSVVMWNCDHPANQRLSLRDVNERPGRDLHAFYWLNESEIGPLHPRWNWLVNVSHETNNFPDSGIAHFTLGGPWIDGWAGAPHDDIWLAAAR